jgi:hypothetical protein
MRHSVVILEFKPEADSGDATRWERSGVGANKAFELLGRAFEVAQRETGEDFGAALQAFFRGALIGGKDVQAVVDTMK